VETVEKIKDAVARAHAADSAGNDTACRQALLEAERAINP
jgi:hypothetical protein